MRFELTTLTLARLCSTPELRPLPWVRGRYKQVRCFARGKSPSGETFSGVRDGNRARARVFPIGTKKRREGPDMRRSERIKLTALSSLIVLAFCIGCTGEVGKALAQAGSLIP